jgi:ferritin-like metal-binding protein YciE
MKIETLHDLFVLKMMALYDMESELVKALPKMAKAAGDPELKQSFLDHLEETKEHVTRLEQVFTILELKPKKTKVEAIRGLVADAEWLIKQKPSQGLLDAVLIASARYVEHYEMAGYLTAIAWAELLDMDDAIEVFEATLEEERKSDMALNEIAEEKINERALAV